MKLTKEKDFSMWIDSVGDRSERGGGGIKSQF